MFTQNSSNKDDLIIKDNINNNNNNSNRNESDSHSINFTTSVTSNKLTNKAISYKSESSNRHSIILH